MCKGLRSALRASNPSHGQSLVAGQFLAKRPPLPHLHQRPHSVSAGVHVVALPLPVVALQPGQAVLGGQPAGRCGAGRMLLVGVHYAPLGQSAGVRHLEEAPSAGVSTAGQGCTAPRPPSPGAVGPPCQPTAAPPGRAARCGWPRDGGPPGCGAALQGGGGMCVGIMAGSARQARGAAEGRCAACPVSVAGRAHEAQRSVPAGSLQHHPRPPQLPPQPTSPR